MRVVDEFAAYVDAHPLIGALVWVLAVLSPGLIEMAL